MLNLGTWVCLRWFGSFTHMKTYKPYLFWDVFFSSSGDFRKSKKQQGAAGENLVLFIDSGQGGPKKTCFSWTWFCYLGDRFAGSQLSTWSTGITNCHLRCRNAKGRLTGSMTSEAWYGEPKSPQSQSNCGHCSFTQLSHLQVTIKMKFHFFQMSRCPPKLCKHGSEAWAHGQRHSSQTGLIQSGDVRFGSVWVGILFFFCFQFLWGVIWI